MPVLIVTESSMNAVLLEATTVLPSSFPAVYNNIMVDTNM
jgi:hypothetical protein